MDYDNYIKRRDTYKENEYKACAEFQKHCNNALKAKIESQVDFKLGIYNNPIKLLEYIKEHSLSYKELRYKMAIIAEAMKTISCASRRIKRVFQIILSDLKCQERYQKVTQEGV